MEEQLLIIHGRLSGRNEAEAAARAHWSCGAQIKKDNTERVMWEAVTQHIKPISGKALVTVQFFEGNLKRDEDNVISSMKYILDGLVNARVLRNDTRKDLSLNILPVTLDRANPRIEVRLMAASV